LFCFFISEIAFFEIEVIECELYLVKKKKSQHETYTHQHGTSGRIHTLDTYIEAWQF